MDTVSGPQTLRPCSQGEIGTEKTTIAMLTIVYQLIRANLRDPKQAFGLERASEPLFVFQSVNERLSAVGDRNRHQLLCRLGNAMLSSPCSCYCRFSNARARVCDPRYYSPRCRVERPCQQKRLVTSK